MLDCPVQNERIRWWPIYHEDEECVGKIQLSIGSTITCDETSQIKVFYFPPQVCWTYLIITTYRILILTAFKFQGQFNWLSYKWWFLIRELDMLYGICLSFYFLMNWGLILSMQVCAFKCVKTALFRILWLLKFLELFWEQFKLWFSFVFYMLYYGSRWMI